MVLVAFEPIYYLLGEVYKISGEYGKVYFPQGNWMLVPWFLLIIVMYTPFYVQAGLTIILLDESTLIKKREPKQSVVSDEPVLETAVRPQVGDLESTERSMSYDTMMQEEQKIAEQVSDRDHLFSM